ncbi:extensin-like [Helianthus annuus]|uniref:extensin-like n=1 Tax=Helianthus annuus TaxID=4232 RepID=UPI000B8F6281|nr:extensin-like [Helianthus annuus]
MSTRGGIRIGTPPHSGSSRYSPLREEPEMGESSHPVSEVTSAPIAPLPPQNFGEPIPTYASSAPFNPFEQIYPPGYDYTGDPYWIASNYSSLPPEGPFGGTWATGQSTFGYPSHGYQQPLPPQPPQYPPPPQAPMMSPPQVQEILQGIDNVRREMRHELREERRHNRGMFKKMVDLIKGKGKKDY